MNRAVEIALWIATIGLASSLLAGLGNGDSSELQIDGLRSNAPSQDQSPENERALLVERELIDQTRILMHEPSGRSVTVEEIASIFRIPIVIEPKEPIEAPPTDETTAKVPDTPQFPVEEPIVEEKPVVEEDTAIDDVEQDIEAPEPPDDPPEPEPEMRTTATWLEYVGRMTRSDVDVYYIKDTRSGRVFSVTEGTEDRYATLDSVEDSILQVTIDGEKLSIEFE